MTKSTERSHERNPFDSRRTNRVSLITPRNPRRRLPLRNHLDRSKKTTRISPRRRRPASDHPGPGVLSLASVS